MRLYRTSIKALTVSCFCMCVIFKCEGVALFLPHFQDRDLNGVDYLGIRMGWAALAPIMWARLMVVIVPLVPKLGSLLEVIKV